MNMRRPSEQTLAVVAALQAQPANWRYGYELCQELNLASGTLYPILIRLTDRGFLETRWEMPEGGGRPRHMYRLTPEGQAWARDVLGTFAERAQSNPLGRPAEGSV